MLQVIFADPERRDVTLAFSRLVLVPSSLPVHFIFAAENPLVAADYQDELLAKVASGKSRDQVKKSKVEGSGHLVAQERPEALGAEMTKVLRGWFSSPHGGQAKL